uniref:GST N-terminal domain-containing protein n=1 Tax=Spongospora subterranea TaxID=70186 RepID=A0A0H5RSE3_9EUKA|eukprot:CRZ11659.1 hypothetical protein [Spongospora subterranea]
MAAPASHIKLTHFDRIDRSTSIRLALTIANIPFQDERVSKEQWATMKQKMPFEQLPVMDIDGELFSETNALLHYVGAIGDLMPRDPIMALRTDQIIGGVDDIIYAIKPTIHIDDHQLKLTKRAALASDVLPVKLQALENLAGNESQDFAICKGLSIADIVLYNLLHWFKSGVLEGVPSEITETYSNLNCIYETVSKNERVIKWNEAHRT